MRSPRLALRSTRALPRAAWLSLLLSGAAAVAPMALPGLGSTAHAQTEEQLARARTLFTEGQAAYDAGRFQEAVTKMREAYDITHSAELAFNVARVYERMSEYADAVRYFRIYLREGQPDAEVRADVEARIEALRAAERRSRDQVFTAPPSDDELTREARTFFTRGVAMFRRGEYEAAMQAFTAANSFAPLPEVLYNMAVVSERLGARRDAIDYYREYLRLRPNAPDRGFVEREIERLRGR
ncbi:MAG: tetratricopeptide repeat protein [Sandaracinaceae bacterium]|nr:tetratricopeptide repeat protein [Sandaracinaceae bacterium]MBK6807629.1 tetratricopeptide repeat protein [Sandaracinaceae bacterium]MBK7155242.1 tetratricopeptide repeat protein [Sandaracinaceae bacterium]MBK7774436.1 tetratricopeptide repeat protein [Sandaracinaceae bacterium]MBK8408978.1 tetratricopeptide repeat protein [Sandaracinaceae bacterium]